MVFGQVLDDKASLADTLVPVCATGHDDIPDLVEVTGRADKPALACVNVRVDTPDLDEAVFHVDIRGLVGVRGRAQLKALGGVNGHDDAVELVLNSPCDSAYLVELMDRVVKMCPDEMMFLVEKKDLRDRKDSVVV